MNKTAQRLKKLQDTAKELSRLRKDAGQQIRSLREDTGLSQKAFAARLGVTQQCVALWEVGTRNPRLSILCKLAKLCDGLKSSVA